MALIFSRKEGERVIIGKAGDVLDRPIVVTLVDRSNEPRIAFDAQRDIRIMRAELVEPTNEPK